MRKFEPKLWPDDLADGAIALLICFIQIFLMFFVPATIIGLLTGISWLGVLSFIALWVGFGTFSVRELNVSDKGIEFVRKFGSPKFLPWDQIEEAVDAKPYEVIWKGWLWPLFPAREMAPSLSCRGHFKISSAEHLAFFPPKDVEGFRQLVRQFDKYMSV